MKSDLIHTNLEKLFNEEALNELAESIKNYGVFQPIIVKKEH